MRAASPLGITGGTVGERIPGPDPLPHAIRRGPAIPAPVIDEVDYSSLPEHMQYGAREYVERGRRPGGFLLAVLRNDLVEAFGKADGTNLRAMEVWVLWLFNEAPRECWGSAEKVNAWVARFT
jgi:hypothetical protein